VSWVATLFSRAACLLTSPTHNLVLPPKGRRYGIEPALPHSQLDGDRIPDRRYRIPIGERASLRRPHEAFFVGYRSFGRKRSFVTKHASNLFAEGELRRESNVQDMHIASCSQSDFESAPWEESPRSSQVIPNWTAIHSQLDVDPFPIGRYSRRLSDVQYVENLCIHAMPKA